MRSIIKNKKALSDIVAVVMIIALSVIAAGLVWAYISPSISGLSPEFNCLNAQIDQLLKIENACFNTATGDVELTISRTLNPSYNINNIEFSIINQDGSVDNYYCGQGCNGAEILSPGSIKTYYFTSSNSQPTEIFVGADGCNLDSLVINPSC